MSLIIACLNLYIAGIDQPFSAAVASLAVATILSLFAKGSPYTSHHEWSSVYLIKSPDYS